ncbi:MAG: aspartate aminotransferase family protein, partial [Chloroflexi bacterium]|nr:aspartate aminotransferase family protein [Chloroflexota bacterium]
SLKYLWMHNRDWAQMAEEGGPPVIVQGKGIRVKDSEGKEWIDVNGGYTSVNVGYGREEIADAAYEQAVKTTFAPVGTTTEPAVRLAAKLAELAPGSLNRSFLVSGGSEANETAIKIARAYHKRRGEAGRFKVISRRGSYHGMTGGVVFAGGGPANPRSDFEPVYPGMLYAPQPNPYRCEMGGTTPSECAVRCAQAVEDLIKFHGPNTVAAFIAEPIAIPQGAPVPGDEYWPMIRDICDRYGVLLIMDEVVCGFGRTGKMFGSNHWDIVPDMMTVAKGIISSYLPVAATIVKDQIADSFAAKGSVFSHVFTNAGHPVTAAAALKNIEIIESENLVQNAAATGAYLKEQLVALKPDHALVGDVRGIGLFVAMEFVSDHKAKTGFKPEDRMAARLTEKLRNHGLLLNSRGDILHLGPPLCITRDDVDQIVYAIDLSLWELEGELGIARKP